LIPAGKLIHKHWLKVACAVMGIKRSVSLDVKKKAARGYIQDDYDAGNSALQGVAKSTRNSNNLIKGDSTSNKNCSRTGSYPFCGKQESGSGLTGIGFFLMGKNRTF
jgi:hypothetical protein